MQIQVKRPFGGIQIVDVPDEIKEEIVGAELVKEEMTLIAKESVASRPHADLLGKETSK